MSLSTLDAPRQHEAASAIHRPRTAHDATLAQLRAWILDGTLAPDERLRQDRLAETLGVSRMPIREALRQLASEGLVKMVPHRGAVVASLNPAEITELYLVRAALERLASEIAAPRVAPGGLAVLRDILDRMEETVDTTNTDEAIELDRRFHDTIYLAAGSPYLHDLIQQARRRSDAFRRAHVHIPGRGRVSLAEHQALFAALAAGDHPVFVRLSHEHLVNASAHLIAFLARERG